MKVRGFPHGSECGTLGRDEELKGWRLWLVRHGETEWSLSGAHSRRTDIPMTEHGRKRAEELRDYLKGTKFDEVFVSPMQRARETCAIAGFGDVAKVNDGLKEWD